MLQTPLVHLVVKHTHDRGQLIKVGTLTQSFGLLLWALWTLPYSRPWDEGTVSKVVFPT